VIAPCVGVERVWAVELMIVVEGGDPGHGLIGVTNAMVEIEHLFVSKWRSNE